jgi:hypothetical protein
MYCARHIVNGEAPFDRMDPGIIILDLCYLLKRNVGLKHPHKNVDSSWCRQSPAERSKVLRTAELQLSEQDHPVAVSNNSTTSPPVVQHVA